MGPEIRPVKHFDSPQVSSCEVRWAPSHPRETSEMQNMDEELKQESQATDQSHQKQAFESRFNDAEYKRWSDNLAVSKAKQGHGSNGLDVR